MKLITEGLPGRATTPSGTGMGAEYLLLYRHENR